MQKGTAIGAALLVGLLLNGESWDSQCQAADAKIDIDCSRSAGEISPYLLGVVAGPYFDPTGLALCKKIGVKIIEMIYDFTPYPEEAVPSEPPRPSGMEPGRGGPPQHGGGPQGPPPHSITPHGFPPPNTKEIVLRQVEDCLKNNQEVMPSLRITSPPQDSRTFQSQVTSYVQDLQRLAKRYNRTIRFYRFGNEPESPWHWNGSRRQFMETFELWVRAVKTAEPQAVIVAPGFEKPTDPGGKAVSGFVQEFLAFCLEKNLPLDILAIHGYGMDPYTSFGLPAQLVSEYLRKFPRLSPVYGTPRLANNEWNFPTLIPKGYESLFDTGWVAAHNISALIQMSDNGIYLAVRYGGCSLKPAIGSSSQEREPEFLLVQEGYRKKPIFYAFEGFARFVDYPQKVSSTSINKNFEVLAGVSPKKDKLYVTVSYYPLDRLVEMHKPKHAPPQVRPPQFVENMTREKSDTNQCTVTIKNIPGDWTKKVRVHRYRVDDTSRGRVVSEETIPIKSRSLTLEWQFPNPGVDFLRLEPLN